MDFELWRQFSDFARFLCAFALNDIVNFHKGAAGESVPILGIDEGYTVLNKLTSTSTSAAQTSLTMERM